MQNGPYIAYRLMPGVIQAACAQQGISYQAFSNDWVLRLQKDETVRWVVGWKFDVNPSAAGQLAQDKVATYTTLAAAHIPAIEHYLVRAVPHDPQEFHYDHDNLEGSVVIKPLDGTGGRGVERYESATAALEAIRHSGEPAWAIAPHYDLQAEYRLVMLNGKVLLALEKTQPTFRGKLKLFNLGYGAVAVDVSEDSLLLELTAMATNVMAAMSLGLASVDIVRLESGELRVLEVNDGITLEHYASQSPEYKARATEAYGAIVSAMFA